MSAPLRWSSVDQVFAQALEQPPEARAAFVDAECGSNQELREEVHSLLRAHEEAGQFLVDPPAVESRDLPEPPALPPGTRLGSFEIVGMLGTGGMGAVYRARDLRLNRSVALKVLAPRSELSGTGRQRFEREARAISQLSHPHICTLYDIGQLPSPAGDGTTIDFLVMELLQGKTLDAALGGTPLPLSTAVRYAAEMADALDCAHREGIVHRDLKPQNVMVTASGLKLLDFGLASIVVPSLPGSPEEKALTNPGLMIGTVQYMAPEQIEGRVADVRADIFSLGLVLHEMLTGSQAFDRPTIVDTLHAVLHDQPPPLPAGVPAALVAIVAHCLEKDRERRFQSARDLKFALTSLALTPGGAAEDVARWRRWVPLALAGTALAAAAGVLGMTLSSKAPLPTEHPTEPFAADSVPQMHPAWSSDGKTIAYVRWDARGEPQIVLRSVDSTVTTTLTSGASGAFRPFWSRDGSRIFFGEGSLQSVNVTGGGVRTEFPDATAGDMSPDGRTLAVWRQTIENGQRVLTLWFGSSSATLRRYQPSPFAMSENNVPNVVRFSPDGSTILLWLAATDSPGVWLLPFPPGGQPPRRVFTESPGVISGADWMPDSRHVVLATRGKLSIGDTQTGVLTQLLASTGTLGWPAVSPSGDRLLFNEDRSDSDVVELSLTGGPPRVVVGTGQNDASPTWSPDGRHLAYVTDRRGHDEIWTRSGEDQSEQPLVVPDAFPGPLPARIISLRYSPDGERLSFVTLATGSDGKFLSRLWVMPSRGGTPRPLVPEAAHTARATWAPDGRSLVVRLVNVDQAGIWSIPVDTAEQPHVILRGPDVHVWHLEWSPTGNLIAGVGFVPPERAARTLVFAPDGTGLRALPDLGSPALLWSRDGQTIYGVADVHGVSTLRALDVATGQLRTVASYGRRLTLFEPINDSLQFMPTPDGKGFVTTSYNHRVDIWMLKGLLPPPARHWSLW